MCLAVLRLPNLHKFPLPILPSLSMPSTNSPKQASPSHQTPPIATPEQIRELLWRNGDLAWKLDSNQRGLHEAFYSSTVDRIVLNCSRRIGKSYLLCVLAVEQALRTPNSEIKYCAPTKSQVRMITNKLFRNILADCPEDIKPEWFAQEKIYEFKNGSTISFGAMDAGRADSLRGTDCHLAIIDEAGFSPSHYVQDMVEGVLRPMCLLTNGKIVIASTPAKTPRHQFEIYYMQAKEVGAALHRTIYDNPRLSPARIEKEKKDALRVSDTFWRREYLAEFVVDEEVIVVPEFSKAAQTEIVVERKRPPHFDAYVAMDVGMKDATGIVFFYWDFSDAKLVVEDEVLLSGVKEVRTDLIADQIKHKERTLWGDQKPYFRVSDTELLLINDLDSLHDLKFIKKDDDSKEAAINELRLMIKTRQIIIHPRCTQLISQLEACVWNAKRDSFERITGFFHFDLVDALIYGLRTVRRNHNPYPSNYGYDPKKFYFYKPSSLSMNGAVVKTLFRPVSK